MTAKLVHICWASGTFNIPKEECTWYVRGQCHLRDRCGKCDCKTYKLIAMKLKK